MMHLQVSGGRATLATPPISSQPILLALVFPVAFFQQTIFVPDTFQRVMADRQVKLAN
jgi:hypothetical protein